MYSCDGTCDTCPAECFYGKDGEGYVLVAQQDDDDEDPFGECTGAYDCLCETCLQNHPERDILYGDGDYYKWE